MPNWRVRDLMTTDVITLRDDESVAEIVTVLTDRRITAVPIVDRFDAVLGRTPAWPAGRPSEDLIGNRPGRAVTRSAALP